MAVKIILLIAYFAVMIGIGFYCRKHSTDVNGFVLGGRSVGPWLTAFAYGTSYFSAVIFVGYAGQFGWKFGLASTWIGLGNAFIGSLLAWAILGRRTRIMTQHIDSATMPQFFEKRFDSMTLKLVSSIIIFIFLIPYTASLYNGLSRLFEMAFNVDYTLCIAIMAILTAVYVIAGGYMATAINDFIQGIIMLIGIVAIIFSVLKINGGFLGSISALALIEDETVSKVPGVFASFFGPDPVSLFGVIILTSLGTWGLPQMVQKFYAIKSEKSIQKGTVISTFFALVVAGGCYFLGGFARLFPVDVATVGFDAIIPKMLSNLSPILVGITLILVMSASMSTLSSLVLTSSSTLTLDFIKPLMLDKKKSGEKTELLIIRAFIAVFILISAIIAVLQYKLHIAFIAQLMGLSWGALAGSFLAPFLYSLYWKRTTKAACLTSFAWGSLLMLANMFFKSAFPLILQSPINCGALAMIGGLVIVPIVSFLTKAPKEKNVEEIFSCYDKKVMVPITEALSEGEE
ncbi:MAG: sodium:solute symporter family protein [Clostridia bacterium]|nr:sodium:solute symporter family protein [Clostridia bacterium]